MPDHAHWLLQIGERDPLSAVVGRLKVTSARAANAVLGREGTLWSRAYHDHALRKEENVAVVARYIICNPVRAKIAQRVSEYPFWNAVWLEEDADRA